MPENKEQRPISITARTGSPHGWESMPEMDLFFVLPLITASLKVFFIIWNNTTIILAPVPRVPKFGAPFPFFYYYCHLRWGLIFPRLVQVLVT